MGRDRLEEGIPWQDIISAGAVLAMGSDWPVESLNPFPIIEMGFTRQSEEGKPPGGFFPKQALTLDRMLAGYTRNAAYAEFREKAVGTLAPGMLPDMVVLSQDLYKVPPNTIGKTQFLLTMVGGQIVWRKGL